MSVWGIRNALLRREFANIAAAVVLPLLLISGFLAFTYFDSRRTELEIRTASHAAEIARLADEVARSNLILAEALATTPVLRRGDPAAMRESAVEIARMGQWRGVVLIDPATGAEILDTRRRLGPPISARPDDPVWNNRLAVSVAAALFTLT